MQHNMYPLNPIDSAFKLHKFFTDPLLSALYFYMSGDAIVYNIDRRGRREGGRGEVREGRGEGEGGRGEEVKEWKE